MHDPLNKNFKRYARIGVVCVLASAPMLVGCAREQGSALSVREEAVERAGGDLAVRATVEAINREDAAAERRERRVQQQRFLRQIGGESNCYAGHRKQHAAQAAMERMLGDFDGRYYSEGHGGDGGC